MKTSQASIQNWCENQPLFSPRDTLLKHIAKFWQELVVALGRGGGGERRRGELSGNVKSLVPATVTLATAAARSCSQHQILVYDYYSAINVRGVVKRVQHRTGPCSKQLTV